MTADDGSIPLEGGDDWSVVGGCAGCGFNVHGRIRQSMIRLCPDCQRALCLVCFEGPGAQGFPLTAKPCLSCRTNAVAAIASLPDDPSP